MPEHLHAEGIDGVLQQRQRLVDRLRAVLANQVQRLFQRGGHPIRLADTPQGQIAKGAAASRSGTEVGSRFLSDLGSFSIAVSVEEYGMSASSNLRFSFEVVPGVPSPRNSRETALVIFRCDMRRLLNRDRKRV